MRAGSIRPDIFGRLPDGEPVYRHTFGNGALRATVLSYGAILQRLEVARDGAWRNLVLSFPSLGEYLADDHHAGAVAGRYANRIRNGEFELDGQAVRLTRNQRGHHLHGGDRGFSKRPWQPGESDDHGITLGLHSHHGDEGYPGELAVTVQYLITGQTLTVRYRAETDRPTVVNLTQHSYFNLDGTPDVLEHELMVAANRVVEAGGDCLPTGRLMPVDGTPLDLRRRTRLADVLGSPHPQLTQAAGLDHCYALDGGDSPAAELTGDIRMQVFTSEPGMQVYTGNHLGNRHQGICLETQKFPDSPNVPGFPTARIDADSPYRSETRFSFVAA